MKKSLGIFVVFLALLSNCFAGKNVDVSDFDILGIKIGMTADEAITALAKAWNINKSLIRNRPGNIPLRISSQVKGPFRYIADKDGKSIEFELAQDLSRADKALVVYAIYYAMPDSKSNRQLLYKLALDKYGEPTSVQRSSFMIEASWCTSARKYPGTLSEHDRCIGSGIAKLKLLNTGLSLVDDRYVTAVMDYTDKYGFDNGKTAGGSDF